jgi:RNA polymerase sigma-70 factor (ECF subfamily)
MSPSNAGDSFRGLIDRARRGDRGARDALVERWQERLLVRIRLMMGADARRHAESFDFLQGVFAKALERLDDVGDERSFLRWMTAVARNDIRDHVGKRREHAFDSLSRSWDASEQADPRTPSPVSEADRDDRWMQLVECLEQLDEHERSVVELRNLEGLTFAAIGARLQCSDDRARLTHMRAMSRLGAMLGRPAK